MTTIARFVRPLSSIALALGVALTLLPRDAAAAHGGAGGGWHGGAAHVGGGWHGGGTWHGGGYRGGYWRHGGYWPGAFWGGVGLGLGIGAISYYGYGPYYGGYYYDPPLVVAPVYGSSDVRSGQPVPQASSAPEPIFYPKNGQSAEATEADRRDCNRWATTQRGAMADATIFQRATLACMEGRGYTAR